MRPRTWMFLALILASGVTSAHSQSRGGAGRRGGSEPLPGNPQRGQMAARRAIERKVRTEVQPTETQLRQLRALDQRFEPQRVLLNREEIAARNELRQLMVDSTNVNQAKIGETLDRLVRFPRRRAELMEAEQKELATILSPLQRAKYLSIQEQVRRLDRGRGGPPPDGPDSTGAPRRKP
jgi:Spy/CpxP family protein refolding chaperone